ncbi:CAAD domain-containing protein [Synechococcus sp. CS-197]|uniref:CAAD domain-containing protein n=1 Tax=Synechococcus sp. CS-197 TaxID=2847985 RepID=UPI000152537B|nr:CAAD domain-containing protein [Synechococcus sp. CS-197]MCT0250897.1 CAAD domain-containing protein [Synechococcus sp. CS-197]CAK24016.1 Conserved hypothetical protein [Synechococcus sp. WH 7803]
MASETPSEAKPSQADITVLGQEEVQNATPAPDPAPADVVDPAEAPAPVPAPAPELTSPSIAERVSVPATPPSGDTSEEGGEWDLLSTKVRQWWGEHDLADQWQRLRRPLLITAALIAFILVLRIYGGVLDAIATIPLAPRLFELVGVIYATWFAATRLVRSEERRKIGSGLGDLWSSVRGKSSS